MSPFTGVRGKGVAVALGGLTVALVLSACGQQAAPPPSTSPTRQPANVVSAANGKVSAQAVEIAARLTTGIESVLRGKREELTPYSHRIYTFEELTQLCRATGFGSVEGYGSWEGAPLSDDSEDLILMAEKPR